MMGFGWGMGPAGWIVMIAFWIAIIALIVWVVTRLLPTDRARDRDRGEERESPEEILDRRFAAGELDPEQYADARARLDAVRGARR